MPIPKREIEELYAKFDLHPDLIEIFVEGEFDYSFLNSYLEDVGAQSATVVCIDDIDIDRETTDHLGLGAGSNKNRVLALSKLFDSRYGKRPTNICCLVDVDLDVVLSKISTSHHLKYTDYSCMEMYFLNQTLMKRFLQLACHLDDSAHKDFLALVDLILPAQFALRAVSESKKIFKATLGFETGLKKKGKFNSFDPLHYCDTYIKYYALSKRRNEIETAFNNIRVNLSNDTRHAANGHDFIHLLYEFVHHEGGLQLHNKEKSEIRYGGRIVALGTNAFQLAKEKLFADISSAVNGQAHLCP